MNSNIDTVILFSGGLDSAACAHYLRKNGHSVRGLFVDYGQRAAGREQIAAERLSKFLDVRLSTVRLTSEQSFGTGEIRGRNAFLIFSCMLLGDRHHAQEIALGIHSGTSYYDCSPAFVEGINRLVAEYSDGCTRVLAPFIQWKKQEIFQYAVNEGIPVEVSYSCEAGALPPCGVCLSCRDRRMLFCLS